MQVEDEYIIILHREVQPKFRLPQADKPLLPVCGPNLLPIFGAAGRCGF
jgi:hypothetical protein